MTTLRRPLTDDLLRRALAERTAGSSEELLGQIVRAAAATPQRRAWSWRVTSRTQRLLLLGAVALLLAALVGAIAVGSGLFRQPNPSPKQDSPWATTGSMMAPRYLHTATLLQDGKVLVAGGADGRAVLGSAELYDPRTGAWTATRNMSTLRWHHTATLLRDGRVLVAGGATGESDVLASAELYDPSTGSWTASGSMITPRLYHTATLLTDGRVLVAGGVSVRGGFSIASAELYDPRTASWTTTGSMTTARQSHTATLLSDGKVLVAGGFGLASAELYDPRSGTWTPTKSMTTPRQFHTATLLPSGEVLVAGGDSSASAELYEPSTRSWTATGRMAAVRAGHTATLLPGGEVLIAGGVGSDEVASLTSAELYDPSTRSWTTVVRMTTPRNSQTATLLTDGKVLLAGGESFGRTVRFLASAELYDPARELALPLPLAYHHNGEITLVYGTGIVGIDPATGTQRVIETDPADTTEYADWSPDGSRLAVISNNQLFIRDLASGTSTQISGNPSIGSPISWAPDGRRVAYEAFDGVHVLDVSSGSDTLLPGTKESMGAQALQVLLFGRPSWSSDGLKVLYVAQRHAFVARVDGSGAHRLMPNVDTDSVAWSPDGKKIAYTADANQVPEPSHGVPFAEQLWIADADGSHPTKLFEQPGCCLTLVPTLIWSPDGTKIAFYLSELLVVDTNGGGVRNLGDMSAPPALPAWGLGRPEMAWRPVP